MPKHPNVYPEACAQMKRRGLYLHDLAEACGVSISTVRKTLVGEYYGENHRPVIEKILGVRLW